MKPWDQPGPPEGILNEASCTLCGAAANWVVVNTQSYMPDKGYTETAYYYCDPCTVGKQWLGRRYPLQRALTANRLGEALG